MRVPTKFRKKPQLEEWLCKFIPKAKVATLQDAKEVMDEEQKIGKNITRSCY